MPDPRVSRSGVCDAVSMQGNACQREREHVGCHEALIDGDSRRWWGDARWAPWEWITYDWTVGAGDEPTSERPSRGRTER